MLLSIFIIASAVHGSLGQQDKDNFDFEKDDDVKKIYFDDATTSDAENVYEAERDLNYLNIPKPGGFDRAKREVNGSSDGSDKKEPVDVSDFIRFRRNLEQTSESKKAPERREKSVEEQRRTGRMLMQDENVVPEGFREARGSTKEQWVKQPYPVRTVNIDDSYGDNIPSYSDVGIPRVHFVTQRRFKSATTPVNQQYEREGRSRDIYRDSESRNEPQTFPPERIVRRYEDYPSRFFNPYNEDAYYRYKDSRFDSRFAPFDGDRDHFQSSSRQRRIIYYATLPEVVRTPPNVSLRNRYNDRDRYDDRYATSPSLSIPDETSYNSRNPFPKSRYDRQLERGEPPYPLKVSTDVNVRETKKNPERRIYSEPDSRYAYKTSPYQADESFNHRTI